MQNHAINQSIKKIAPVAAVAFVATMLVGAFSFTTIAFAAVTFDPETGEGFVGKGDVQEAFGWNNKQLQQNAEGVKFAYQEHTRADVTCEGTDNKDRVVEPRTQNKVSNLNSQLDGDPRQVKGQKQFTGFIIDGVTSTGGNDNIGELGDSCSFGNIAMGTITNIEIKDTTSELIAIFNGEERTLRTL